MTILQALNAVGERLEAEGKLPAEGYSTEKVSFVISLYPDGRVANISDKRILSKKKAVPAPFVVPQPVKRTSGIAPNFLWDKSSYVLGVSMTEGGRVAEEHAAFRERHLEVLADETDEGLVALRLFLERWTPDQFEPPLWPEEMKDQNIIFVLETDRLASRWLHLRPAAKALMARISGGKAAEAGLCLVSGERGPVARLHPAIKGVWGAQSSGASIVSFNLDAFTSYGHEQGANAPVSEAVAARYVAALNLFLRSDSGHFIQIGDASTVFWAEAASEGSAGDESLALAEGAFAGFLNDLDVPDIDEHKQANEVVAILAAMKTGRSLKSFRPDLAEGVRFHVLGLSPNAARISIRFYLQDDFGRLADNYSRFLLDTAISPPPRQSPALWRYLLELAVLGKKENVPPNLAGEWLRAILSGAAYPMTLLSATLMRLRAGGEVNALRAAMLRAVLVRNFNLGREAPVAFDPDNEDRGYLLGRLFATYEQIQYAALGKVNASIRDKYFASASTQPRKVFGLLASGAGAHMSKLGKQKPGYATNLEKGLMALLARMSPGNDPFPVALSPQEQALFALGYYHQKNEFFKSHKDDKPLDEEASA